MIGMFNVFKNLDPKSVVVGAAGTALIFGGVIGGIKLRDKLRADDDFELDDEDWYDDDDEDAQDNKKSKENGESK